MKRLPLAALGALLLATGGCASMADVYDPAPQPSGYMSPAEGVPSATLVIVTPATLQGLQGRMIFNLPVDGQLTSVDYFLSRNPIRGSDRVAVPWRGVGDASYIRVHVHRPVYISARAVLSSYNCQNDVSSSRSRTTATASSRSTPACPARWRWWIWPRTTACRPSAPNAPARRTSPPSSPAWFP
ncbi:hypothetical protein [Brevundimonas sp.]|uniref:hypothetical protein n=1 Tax=Brevundimonas sp. TaxID=1871086 RepID=UPI002EDA28BB